MYKSLDVATAIRNYFQLKATTIYTFSPVIVIANSANVATLRRDPVVFPPGKGIHLPERER